MPSNPLNVQQIYQRIQSGIDQDQVVFNEGRITFWNLQTLDHKDNPQFHSDTPDAAGEYSLSTFQEETEREVEVEEEHQTEGEDSQAPLQPIQEQSLELTHSGYILDSEIASQSISINSELSLFNDPEWEEHLQSQLNKVFKLPRTP